MILKKLVVYISKFTKNNLTLNLGKQFSDHSIKRKYLCLVWGVVEPLRVI